MKNFDTLRYSKVVEDQQKPAVMIKHKATEQVHIALGVRTVSGIHDDRYPLAVLSAILGGGMSSRLFHEVREKRGLAYYVRSSSDHYMDCGSLASVAGVAANQVPQAVDVIVEEYKKIKSEQHGITKEELKKAKEYLKGHMVLELEDSRSVASFYSSQELLEDKIDNPDDVLVEIDKVTKEQVVEVAKKYMVNTGLNLAIIGNFEDKAQFEKLLEV